MSFVPGAEPVCSRSPALPAIAAIIDARRRDVAGLEVRRLLPASARRLVGPFLFFDHLGPVTLAPGQGIDVPPHPHIGLATVTYLLAGELLHRDSLGSRQPIRPGDINWMTAGRGIVHSERTPAEVRRQGSRLHALQLWVALPRSHEEVAPAFAHHPHATLPERELDGVRLRVLAGTAYGATSPVATLSPLFYVDAAVPAGCTLPLPEEHAERALYVLEGAIECGPERAAPGRMLVLAPAAKPTLRAAAATRVMIVGGAPIDGERHIAWNFVSSSPKRLEQARHDWAAGRFPKVPGDDQESMPLPP